MVIKTTDNRITIIHLNFFFTKTITPVLKKYPGGKPRVFNLLTPRSYYYFPPFLAIASSNSALIEVAFSLAALILSVEPNKSTLANKASTSVKVV